MVDDAETGTEDQAPEAAEPAPEAPEAPEDAASGEAGEAGEPGADDKLSVLEHEGEVAADYLEALLDILDMDGDLELDIEGERASVAIVGDGLDDLVGQRGQTLEALQELTRLAVLQETGQRSRLMLDVGGYRARRKTELTRLATEAGERVAANGQDERLAPMTPFERKVVHDTIAGLDGVMSESEGEEPQRRVVVRPA
ncbi:MAG TPA: R3H domain-containing nucleic acid-binding protein [Frankiaceae bacterium]|nr:R3H domain-containing nucleic acid-binding protein [Frankiaceae bacterium]